MPTMMDPGFRPQPQKPRPAGPTTLGGGGDIWGIPENPTLPSSPGPRRPRGPRPVERLNPPPTMGAQPIVPPPQRVAFGPAPLGEARAAVEPPRVGTGGYNPFPMPGTGLLGGGRDRFLQFLREKLMGKRLQPVPPTNVSGAIQPGLPSVGFRPQEGLGAFPRRPIMREDVGGYVGMPNDRGY